MLTSLLLGLLAVLADACRLPAADNPDMELTRVFGDGVCEDVRLERLRTLNDKLHPWSPPDSREAWDAERERIQRQVSVALGLWPMPAKTPLRPVIHSPVEKAGYTVYRVYFESRPGLYVTGSLYRPANDFPGLRPGVLCPHGHWADGRFYDAGDAAAKKQIEQGAEVFDAAAHSPLQARMVQLARMGCVVFHYDMIGYADAGPLDHRTGFNDARAELESENIMGLQTWNSIRALDFIESLDGVDPDRLAVTGASGGGTQTFLLAALDDRPDVLFPAVMVSTAMQGGCVCENASYLRLGLNNVALAALAAPRPMAMSGADDWTIDIETLGLPELKQVYGFYDRPELVDAKCWPQFGHNYNLHARTMMYTWFNQHLKLGLDEPIEERDFERLSRDELTVFTVEHPRPDDALLAEQLRARLTEENRIRFNELLDGPREEYRHVVGGAAEVLVGSRWPLDVALSGRSQQRLADGTNLEAGTCEVVGSGEQVPFVRLTPAKPNGQVVLWIDEAGKQAAVPAVGRACRRRARTVGPGDDGRQR
ncbi:MAG: acetylxylan esterase [Planctomycetaceae bacterium]